MFKKRTSFNPKRSISDAPTASDLKRWTKEAKYGGNPEHKRNPGDFGLIPPSSPRADKTLCDKTGIFSRAAAAKLLREGIKRGLISRQVRNGYPQNVWSVSPAGIPVEAQLENPDNGTYHGYPMPKQDPFREKVIAKWQGLDD